MSAQTVLRVNGNGSAGITFVGPTASLPTSCGIGELAFVTDAAANQQLYASYQSPCAWQVQAGISPISSVSNSDGTLAVSPTTGAIVASLNPAHANTWSAAQTFTGGVVNTTSPIRDQTRFVLVASMTAVATAGVQIGSTGSGNSIFSWPVTSANWYDLECKLPVTFVSSATIRFELVSISGSVTLSHVNAETMGSTGSSAAFQDLSTIGGTTLAGSETPVTGAPGAVSEQITYSSQFLTSHAGNIGLEFLANGSNDVTLLLGGECGITQIN